MKIKYIACFLLALLALSRVYAENGSENVRWIVGDPADPVVPFSLPAGARIRVPRGFSIAIPSGWNLDAVFDDGVDLESSTDYKIDIHVRLSNFVHGLDWRRRSHEAVPAHLHHQFFAGKKEAWWGLVHYAPYPGMAGGDEFFGTVSQGTVVVGVTAGLYKPADWRSSVRALLELAQSLRLEAPISFGKVDPLDFKFDVPDGWKTSFYVREHPYVQLDSSDLTGTIYAFPAPARYRSAAQAEEDIGTYFARAGARPDKGSNGSFLWSSAAGVDSAHPKNIEYLGVASVNGKLYFVQGVNLNGKNAGAFKKIYLDFVKSLGGAGQ